ncbi:MAG: hypothetical protein ACFFEF_04170 [Candidatus Thorarchaeota archaeon]
MGYYLIGNSDLDDTATLGVMQLMERPDYSSLVRILEEMNKEGAFTASVLARDDGFLIASAVSATTHPDVVAAMSGYVADTVERMRNELGLGNLKDISVRCSEGKAVFRKIASQRKQGLILAAIMPRKIRYHARPVGKATTLIRKILGYRK